MSLDLEHGNVLIIADEAPGERLRRWVESAGERAVLLAARNEPAFGQDDDAAYDLVVTELDSARPEERSLLERMLEGEILFGVPQLHLMHDPALLDRFVETHPDSAAMAILAPGQTADVLARVRLAAEIGRLRRELIRSAIRDDLTGAYNRGYLTMRLEQEIARASRHDHPLSLVLLEVDEFAAVNQRAGLEAGDELVSRFAALVAPRMRREDVLARWDERTFGVLLSNSGPGGASTFVRQLHEASAAGAPAAGPLHFSSGVASVVSGHRATSPDDLLRAARNALGRAHELGGDRVFVDPSAPRRARRLVVIADDDPVLAEGAAEVLALDDYEVACAETPAALLTLLATRRPDLIVLGLHLAQAAAGDPTLLDKIHALGGPDPLPVVALAPALDDGPRSASTRLRVDRFLTKPFSASVLRALARDLIGPALPPRPLDPKAEG